MKEDPVAYSILKAEATKATIESIKRKLVGDEGPLKKAKSDPKDG